MFSNSQAFAFFGQQIAFKFIIQVLLSSFFSGINNFFLHKQNVNFKNKFKGWLISSWAISNLPRSYSLRVPLQWSIFREWRNLHTQRQYSLNLNQTTTHCNCLNNSQYSNLCRCSLKKKSIPSKVKLSTQFRLGEWAFSSLLHEINHVFASGRADASICLLTDPYFSSQTQLVRSKGFLVCHWNKIALKIDTKRTLSCSCCN